MTSTVEALQAVYVALGGSLTDTYSAIADGAAVSNYVTIPDCVNAIAQVATSASSGLPTVTASDNGKVLGVVNGAWAAMDAPTELPDVTASDNGDVLGVISGEWAVMAVPTELPTVTADDNGDVLTVVDGAWAAASGS